MTSAPRRIRTFDLPLRRRSLYPLSYRGRYRARAADQRAQCRAKLNRSPAAPAIGRSGILGWGGHRDGRRSVARCRSGT